MHQDRFYIPTPPVHDEVWIEDKEAHHILHVKRAAVGGKITLFDGKGVEYLARIVEVKHGRLRVQVEHSQCVNRELPVDITIAFSVPKGKHSSFVIQKCAELGVKSLIPLHCERSVVDFRHKSIGKTEKWDKIAIEASKQCKRNVITNIEDMTSFDDLLKDVHNYELSIIASVESPAKSLKSILLAHPSVKKILCLIGPEGGFTGKEMEKAVEAGCLPASIGTSTLRIETAAVAISAVLLYAYTD